MSDPLKGLSAVLTLAGGPVLGFVPMILHITGRISFESAVVLQLGLAVTALVYIHGAVWEAMLDG